MRSDRQANIGLSEIIRLLCVLGVSTVQMT